VDAGSNPLTTDQRFRSQGYRIANLPLPTFLVRLVALFDKTAQNNILNLGRDIGYDNTKIRETLGWQPLPIEDSIIEMGESLIRVRLV